VYPHNCHFCAKLRVFAEWIVEPFDSTPGWMAATDGVPVCRAGAAPRGCGAGGNWRA
jgi:hypothetical protein